MSLPRDFTKLILLSSVTTVATFTVAQIVFSQLPTAQAETWKASIMENWEAAMIAQWNTVLGEYNTSLKDGENAPDPEDLQHEYNEVLREVRMVAEKALWPNGRPNIENVK